jgi:predicted Zn-dependent protease
LRTIFLFATIGILTFASALSAGSISNPGFESVDVGTVFDTPVWWDVENYAAAVTGFTPNELLRRQINVENTAE